MMRRDLFSETGGCRAAFRYAQDYDLWLRLADGHRIANLAEPVLRYRLHAGQISMLQPEQQAVSALGARVAAQQRREFGSDAFGQLERVSPGVLYGMGLSPDSVERATLEHYISIVDLVSRGGSAGMTTALPNDLAKTRRFASLPNETKGDLYWTNAKDHYAHGRFVRCLISILRASASKPTLLSRVPRSCFTGAIRRGA